MDLKFKNRRLCEKIKAKSCRLKKSVSKKGKCSNSSKSKSKKDCQSTFSMIKFYESIPNYEQVRDLPAFDFTERVNLLKKIHCDLSQPLINKSHCEPFRIPSATLSHKKTSAKKKKRDSPLKRNTISSSLCKSFSKTTLNDFDKMDDCNPKSNETLRSADSNRTPTPLKRLKILREKLSKTFLENECTNDKPIRLLSPPAMCSPIFSEMKSPLSFDIESHPCDLYFNNCNSIFEMEYRPPVSFRDIYSSPRQPKRMEDKNSKPSFTVTSPPSDEEHRHRRSKSCPKELFETKKPCLNFQTDDNIIDSNSTKQQHADNSISSLNAGDCKSSVSSRQRNTSKIVSKSKSKTPNSMDEYLSSKMVRSNLAANLRQKWSRKRINEMAEEKLKATMTVTKCIPKCHRWHVKNTNAWKSFMSEDNQTENRLRELARKEEQRLRQHAHAMFMNIMRAKVESAQLLLEGRALSAKS